MGGMSGGGGKGQSAPAAPNFDQLAREQAQYSQQAVNAQTQANRPNQTNAFGATSQWTQDPTTGQWTQQTSLGGGLGQGATGLENQIGSQGPLSTGDQARQQAIAANFGAAQGMLAPIQAQQTAGLNAQLAAQGLDPGSQAGQNAIGNMQRNQAFQNEQAMQGAINQGNQAQALTFGENVQAQQNPYQELGMLSGLTQQQQTPYASQAQVPQLLSAAQQQYQAALQNQSNQQAGKNSMLSGIGGIAGGVGGLALGGPLGGMVGSQIGSML